MYTQCPECLTIYQIDEDALQASLGIVQCGSCAKRFDALRSLSDALPIAPLMPLPEQDAMTRAPTLTEAVPPSAYELAARKRRARDDAAPDASAEQHELDLPASESAEPTAADVSSRTSPDDWFADIESELITAPVETSSDAVASVTDAADGWAVELPDDSVSESADANCMPSAAASVSAAGDVPEIQSEPAMDALYAALADEPMPQERVEDSLAVDIGFDSEAAATKPDMPLVVSPRLLEGDVYGASIEAPASTEDAMVNIDGDTLTVTATAADAAAVEPVRADVEAADANPDADSAAASPPAPVYVRPRRHRISAAAIAWVIGCLLLALALAAQLAWANRVELIRNLSTRAWTTHMCQNVPCRLPPIKDLAQLELISRDVRPDPNAAGALTITATVRNDASFRQPWPVVVVELTDIDNHAVAMRRFRPAEYMPDPARRASGIAAGATAALAFEVADPGKSASGFRFGFE